ncbi:MAG: hypothetical protein ACQKBY_00255 [Verrucomicrobiales bacterium]
MLKATILALLSLLPLAAQNTPPQIKTEIVTVALDLIDGKYFYLGKNEALPFPMGMNGLGRPFAYEGPTRFILHSKPAHFNKPEEGQAPPPPAAVVSLPKSPRILIVCATGEPGKPKLAAFDISEKALKNGDYLTFNFSTKNLAIVLGEKKFALPKGRHAAVSHPSWQRGIIDIPCQIGVVEGANSKIRPTYSRIWGHRPIRRNVLFIMDRPSRPSEVTIRRFYDIILPKEDE